MTTAIRLSPLLVVPVVIALYHAGGLHFLFWADSHGYLVQAESLFGADTYQRPSARNVGYPLFLSGVLSLSHTALALILAQVLLVVLAYTLLYRHICRAMSDLSPNEAAAGMRLRAWMTWVLVATTSYSALHVFMLSLLPEILFAVLALLAVVAVSWLLLRPPGETVWWPATLAACAATLPALVKPHWLLAALVLVAVVAAQLALSQLRSQPRQSTLIVRAALAGLVPFAVLAAVLAPDRYLASMAPKAELFGPRTLFCNHLHFIEDALEGKRSWQLVADPNREARLKAAARKVLATQGKPWRYLGFNGDHCMYNQDFLDTVAAELPDQTAERAFYMAGFKAAVLGDPIRFGGKVLRQIVLGIEQSFAKSSFHLASPAEPSNAAAFLVGTSRDGEAGPLRSKARMKQTPLGLLVMALLALVFAVLTVVFAGLLLLSLLAAPLRFRDWTSERQRHFAAYVGVPLLAVVAHHMLIGIAHSFDIWRYAFGVFFVSIGFVLTAGLFWRGEAVWLRSVLRSR